MTALDSHPWVFLLIHGGGTAGAILATYLLWRFINKGTLKQIGFRGSLKDLWFGLFLGCNFNHFNFHCINGDCQCDAYESIVESQVFSVHL